MQGEVFNIMSMLCVRTSVHGICDNALGFGTPKSCKCFEKFEVYITSVRFYVFICSVTPRHNHVIAAILNRARESDRAKSVGMYLHQTCITFCVLSMNEWHAHNWLSLCSVSISFPT